MLDCPIIKLSNGVEIPQFGLGVFRSEPGEETAKAVEWALEAGYRHIDTAAGYRNEQDVAAGLKASGLKREEVFITSKLSTRDIEAENGYAGTMASLEKLDTDYIDLYLLHWPITNFEKAWEVINKFYADGKIRAIGLSNFQVHHVQKIIDMGLAMPVVDQIELHPGFQEKELKPFVLSKGMFVEAWSPLGGQSHLFLDHPAIVAIANKYGKTGAQVIIRWHLQSGNIVIPKSVKQNRIVENSQVFDFALSDEDMAAINAIDTNERSYGNPFRWDV